MGATWSVKICYNIGKRGRPIISTSVEQQQRGRRSRQHLDNLQRNDDTSARGRSYP